MYLTTVSPQAQAALTVSRRYHYSFRVIANNGMITQPLYKNGWWFLPTDDSSPDIKACKRIAALKSANIPIAGYIIAHQTTNQLPAPQTAPVPQAQQATIHLPWKTVAAVLGGVLTAVFYVTGVMVVLVAGALLDPAVVVVLSDGTWLEVETWYEPLE